MKKLRADARSLFMVPRAGLEPATLGLEVLCSIQLSYRGVVDAHFHILAFEQVQKLSHVVASPLEFPNN